MLHSIRRVGIVCAVVLVPIVVLLVATYPRIAAGAKVTGNIAASPEQPRPVIAGGDAAVPLDPGSLPNTDPAAPSGQGQVSGIPGYWWNYSAKFVCGISQVPQPGTPGEPPVKPGNYATEINIHNYNYKGFVLIKKVIPIVAQNFVVAREPQQGLPRTVVVADLGADNAMMDDCNAIWTMLYQTTTLPIAMPLTIGYLVVLSPLDLDVDVVYTAAEPGTPSASIPGGFASIAIDVTRVLGKRVYVPVMPAAH